MGYCVWYGSLFHALLPERERMLPRLAGRLSARALLAFPLFEGPPAPAPPSSSSPSLRGYFPSSLLPSSQFSEGDLPSN